MKSDALQRPEKMTNKTLKVPQLGMVVLTICILSSLRMLRDVSVSCTEANELPSLPDNFFGRNESQRVPTNETAFRNEQDDVVFYNIFIPDPSRSRDSETKVPQGVIKKVQAKEEGRVFKIIQEQLQQVLDEGSYRTVHYSLIGKNVSHSNEVFCRLGLDCHRLQYAKQGFEEVTLQHLYEYCIERPHARVAYIHDKGSFHWSRRNDEKRKRATKVAVSDTCRFIPTDADECNVCAPLFFAKPHRHTPAVSCRSFVSDLYSMAI